MVDQRSAPRDADREQVARLGLGRGSESLWSDCASAYDDTSVFMTRGLNELVARLSGAARPGAKILEIGCGPGYTSRALARAGAEVTATDFAQGMVDLTRKLADEEGLALQAEVQDATALGFADASFDFCFGMFSLYAIPERQLAIGEIRRVLRPGGRLISAALLSELPGIEYQDCLCILSDAARAVGLPFDAESITKHPWARKQRWIRDAEEAGFSHARVLDISVPGVIPRERIGAFSESIVLSSPALRAMLRGLERSKESELIGVIEAIIVEKAKATGGDFFANVVSQTLFATR